MVAVAIMVSIVVVATMVPVSVVIVVAVAIVVSVVVVATMIPVPIVIVIAMSHRGIVTMSLGRVGLVEVVSGIEAAASMAVATLEGHEHCGTVDIDYKKARNRRHKKWKMETERNREGNLQAPSLASRGKRSSANWWP